MKVFFIKLFVKFENFTLSFLYIPNKILINFSHFWNKLKLKINNSFIPHQNSKKSLKYNNIINQHIKVFDFDTKFLISIHRMLIIDRYTSHRVVSLLRISIHLMLIINENTNVWDHIFWIISIHLMLLINQWSFNRKHAVFQFQYIKC